MNRSVVIWICFLIISSAFVLIDFTEKSMGQTVTFDGMEYTDHAPIRIESNADFNTNHGITGGSGIENDPWIIEGYNISESGLGYSIYVGNTTDYFVIRNCNIRDSEGIFLYYVNNALIEYVDIQNADIGIYAYYCNFIVIQHTIISFTQIYGYSIELHRVDYTTIKNVTLSNSPNGGLLFDGWCKNALVTNCNIQWFTWGHGIHLEDSFRITLRNNLIANNGYGVYILYGEGHKIYHNNIIDNTNPAYEYAIYPSPHVWNDTYPSGGNYWSHYTGVDEYSGPDQNISGSDGIGDTNITWLDQYPLMEEYDITPPTSSINFFSHYWNANPIYIIASLTDLSLISNITLYYSFSTDNITWNSWTSYEIKLAEPWIWLFDFPTGDGYYRFCTIATDLFDNVEAGPNISDVYCTFDWKKPIAITGLNQTVPQNTTVTLNGSNSTDNFGIDDYRWNFTYDGAEITIFGIITNFTFDIPGNYTVTLNITDVAGNFNYSSLTITVLDTEKPIADAGLDQNILEGNWTALSGVGSSDNIGIINYTWTFVYNDMTIVLNGVLPEFRFWTPGNYSIVLNVTDESGNWDTDIVMVNVEPLPSSVFEYWLILIIIIAVIISGVALLLRKKPDKTSKESTLCPGCGFEIEKGKTCPFCEK